jgi:hypothetical protein
MAPRVAMHLRTCQRGLASAQGHVVTQFNRQFEFSRTKKPFVNAMVHVPDAQGPVGETAKPYEAIHRLAFLRRSSLDENVSSDYHLLADCARPVPMDEGRRS